MIIVTCWGQWSHWCQKFLSKASAPRSGSICSWWQRFWPPDQMGSLNPFSMLILGNLSARLGWLFGDGFFPCAICNVGARCLIVGGDTTLANLSTPGQWPYLGLHPPIPMWCNPLYIVNALFCTRSKQLLWSSCILPHHLTFSCEVHILQNLAQHLVAWIERRLCLHEQYQYGGVERNRI